MKKLCVLLATIFIFNFSAYALTESDPDETIILDSEVVSDNTDQNDTTDPALDDINTTTVDKSAETAILSKDTKDNTLLYVGIGVGTSIILATIGYVTTKIEQKKQKNNNQNKNI